MVSVYTAVGVVSGLGVTVISCWSGMILRFGGILALILSLISAMLNVFLRYWFLFKCCC